MYNRLYYAIHHHSDVAFWHRALPEDEADEWFSELSAYCLYEPSDEAFQQNPGLYPLHFSQHKFFLVSYLFYCVKFLISNLVHVASSAQTEENVSWDVHGIR